MTGAIGWIGRILIVVALGVPTAVAAQDGSVRHRVEAFARTAQGAPSQLPGGATSLREVHGDWVVACNAAEKGKSCSVSQQQNDSRSGQRVLAIEFGAPTADGVVPAALVLPFGLHLGKGLVIQIDEAAAGPALSFKTCLPAGCIIETVLARQALDAWRKGSNVKLRAFAADTGSEVPLTISLKGLAQALDRAAALGK